MKNKIIIISILSTFLLLSILTSLNTLANAQEPIRPALDYTFDAETDAKVQSLKTLPIDKVLKRLHDTDFSYNEELLHQAMFTALKHRKRQAIIYAVNLLKLPRTESIDGRPVSRHADLYIAKKTFEVFPKQAVNELLHLYGNSDPSTRGNIIYAVGKMAGGQAIRNLLIEALDDMTYYDDEETYPEGLSGPPLRICDLAYNQLVLRYRIKNVLRTIGHVYRIEVRDYHINILKDKLQLLP
jgi:hypothetical protein